MFGKKKKEKFQNRVNQSNRITSLAGFDGFNWFLTKAILYYKPVWKESRFDRSDQNGFIPETNLEKMPVHSQIGRTGQSDPGSNNTGLK